MRQLVTFGLLIFAAILMSSCGGATPTEESAARASAIVCSTAYRVAQTEPPTEVDTMRLTDADADAAAAGGMGATAEMPYIYLTLHAQYWSGAADGERALRLWVTPTASEELIVSQLFQLPTESGPTNQFRGGHGFTGLNYAYDPTSGAELQYWCAAE